MSNEVGAPEEAVLMERVLRWTEAFAQWPALSMTTLLTKAKLVRVSKGELLWSDAGSESSTLLIVSGYALAHRIKTDGTRLTLGVVGPGRMTNFARMAEVDDDWQCVFVAHGDTAAIVLPSTLLIDLLDAEPRLWPSMSRMLLRHQRESFNGLVDRTTGALRERLASTIERLATSYGVFGNTGQTLRVRLSQEDLGTLLQVSRQTVNKGVRALEATRIIRHDYGSITILDRESLRKAAGMHQHG